MLVSKGVPNAKQGLLVLAFYVKIAIDFYLLALLNSGELRIVFVLLVLSTASSCFIIFNTASIKHKLCYLSAFMALAVLYHVIGFAPISSGFIFIVLSFAIAGVIITTINYSYGHTKVLEY